MSPIRGEDWSGRFDDGCHAHISVPSALPHFRGYFPIMESGDRLLPSGNEHLPPLPEDDPELEREIEEWARLLLDVYLWRLQEERKAHSGDVDTEPPPPKI